MKITDAYTQMSSAKVERLRAAIKDGSFHVDANKIANKLLDHERRRNSR